MTITISRPTSDDVDRFEVNDASAAVALVVQAEWDIDPARFNVDEGAIAHRPPIGAPGAILSTKVAHALHRLGQAKAVVSLCIGGAQGIATCLETGMTFLGQGTLRRSCTTFI